ncbi:alpha/beta fold hydrolase [Macrococcus brunensis]|uniref:alpha/beta fold hydrolase n=1 Tax=Macrococcus brunensis TaxID=198483 RepID=UPI001EF157C9|nr:alpha/beta hydrolase [Macrococcus brunensis]ULG74254.1 alpha/beta hydrolase [Macrococcus brunensis]
MFHVKQLMINGIQYEFVDEGRGKPVLLLHGFPDSKKLWYQMMPQLIQNGYRVIAPDLRGYGNTALSDSYRIEDSAADMFTLLAQLDIARTHVIGHDWGACLGWYMAANYEPQVISFTALSVGHPSGYFRSGGLKQMMKGSYIGLFILPGVAEQVLAAGDYKALTLIAENDRMHEHWYMDLTRPGRLSSGLNWYRYNIKTIVAGIDAVNVPVMGIIGNQDPALTSAQMKASANYIYASFHYHEIEGGHWLPETHANELNRLILPFLSNYMER